MAYNQSYGSDAHSYKMSYNPTYVQPQQAVAQPTPQAYAAPQAYNFGTPYNKPMAPLTRPPTFLYQVQNNPYLRQNQPPPPNQQVAIPPPAYRSEPQTTRVKSPPSIKKKVETRKTREERLANNTMNIDRTLMTVDRSVVDIQKRYPRMFVPMDFTKTTFHCLKVNEIPKIVGGGNGSKIILDNLLGRVIPSAGDDDSVSQVASLDRFNVKHNARVMIGFVDQSSTTSTVSDDKRHFFNCYKFLVGKKDRSSLLSLGGSWVKELDGDDPNDDAVLRNTLMRTVRNYCGLDLSTCREWMKFIEIFFHRPSEVIDDEEYPEIFERTVVFFIPDASSLFPKSHEEYATSVKNRLELIMKFEGQFPQETVPASVKRMPKQPSVFVYTKKKKLEEGCKTISLSLDGLLDYNIEDRQEKTFEISLFAEALKEMMQKCHTQSMQKFLDQIVGRKRKREQRQQEEELDGGSTIVNTKETKKRRLEKDHPAYHGFKHFDKDSLGYVLVRDLESLILAQSDNLSQGDARTLAESCADENNSKRIAYQTLEYEEGDEFDDDDDEGAEIMGQDAEELFKNFQV